MTEYESSSLAITSTLITRGMSSFNNMLWNKKRRISLVHRTGKLNVIGARREGGSTEPARK